MAQPIPRPWVRHTIRMRRVHRACRWFTTNLQNGAGWFEPLFIDLLGCGTACPRFVRQP